MKLYTLCLSDCYIEITCRLLWWSARIQCFKWWKWHLCWGESLQIKYTTIFSLITPEIVINQVAIQKKKDHFHTLGFINALSDPQSKVTSVDKAFQFCLYLLRTSDGAFDVLLSALKKTGQQHISDELQRMKYERWVTYILSFSFMFRVIFDHAYMILPIDLWQNVSIFNVLYLWY